MELQEVMEQHLNWTSKTFPKGTSTGAMLHAKREADEVISDIKNRNLTSLTDRERLAVEYADILGCITDSFTREGFTVADIACAWNEKLQINKSRVWKDNGDGSYSHIKK